MKYYTFDTEDNSKGKVYLLIFYNGINYYIFKKPEKAILFLDKLLKRNKKRYYKFYAHNCLYDLINLFQKNIDKLNIYFFGKTKRFIYANYKRIYFYDTYNIFPVKLKKLGEINNLKKINTKNFNNIEYCKRDCEIIYISIDKLLKQFKLKKIKSTLASISYKLYETDFNIIHIEKLEKDVLDYFKQFYFGGRTEILQKREYTYKNIISYDINSLYPYTMKRYLYPIPYYYYESKKFLKTDELFIVNADIETEINLFPVRSKFDVNDFTNKLKNGFFSNVEIDFLKENNIKYKIKNIKKIIYFPNKVKPFIDFVDYFYEHKKNAKNKSEKFFYKIILNSLYGKFATGGTMYQLKKYTEKEENKFIEKQFFGYRILNYLGTELLEVEINKGYPYYSNVIFSVYITAYSRIETFKIELDVNKNYGKILYIDTDSFYIKFKNKKCQENFENKYLDTEKIGLLKKENTFKIIKFFDRKMYYGITNRNKKIIKCSGIPNIHAEKYLLNNRVKYKKPIRLLEAITRQLQANVWLDIEKIRKK